jgi:shikimate kinase
MTRPALVLVGAPGAGKSTLGALLAQKLDVPFRDTDADIERTAGKAISDIFIDDGEPHFRDLERAAVAEALRTHPGVLALGGGAVLTGETRSLLEGHQVVYLEVGLAEAARRVGLARDRPVLALNPRATLHHLLAARRPLYQSVARHTVGTDKRTPADIAAEVLELTGAR